MRAPVCCLLGALFSALTGAAGATDDPGPAGQAAPDAAAESGAAASQPWNLHAQLTHIVQYHPAFRSPYEGGNSLDPGNSGRESADLTLFAGVRLWGGGALYFDPEIDQGFGLSGTLGLAGFSSGDAVKVGEASPYYRTPRLFVRQVFDLGGETAAVASGPNQLAGPQAADNVTLTAGKFSAVDIFDGNGYAHDPRADFMNWAVIDSGAYDYAADAWGYTYGAVVEWTRSWWTLRGGVLALSRVPNERQLDRGFGQFELVAEFERRHAWRGHPGKLKLLAYDNRGRMGSYDDAVGLAQQTGTAPETAAVRHMASRPGLALNIEQELGRDVGAFARASWNDGSKETYEFTDINRSLSAGLSLTGSRWSRPQDGLGVAAAVNGLSTAARRYFAAGGLGVMIGDGQLPHYGLEKIVETYYAAALGGAVTVSADFQFIANPAYNADRGPVSIFGLRLHVQI